MPLPPAVRQRADEARRRAHEMVNAASPPEEQPNQPVAPPVPKAPEPERAPPVAEVQPPTVPEPRQPSPSEPSEPAPATTPADTGFIDPNDWESRYKVLRSSREGGRAEVQAATAKVAELEREVQALREQNSRRETPEPEAPRFEIDAESREYIGDTEAKLFDRMSASTDARFKELSAETERLKSEASAREGRQRNRFFEDLGSSVPNWQVLNEDPAFLAWLAQPDASTGVSRHSLLNGFVDDHDSVSAVQLFNAYARGMSAPREQPAQPPVSPEPTTGRPAGQLGAEEQLVEVYSPAEVSEFYAQKSQLYRSGKLRGQVAQDIAAEEAKIKLAIQEQRVY